MGCGHISSEVRLRLVIVALVAFVVGCQTTMSVEQAKKVTTAFQGTAFVPPPRTINDIAAILDQQRQENPEVVVRARAKVSEAEPQTTDPVSLARFFFDRGFALRQLGRESEALGDLKKALQAARAGRAPVYRILIELGHAEDNGGEIASALEYWREAEREIPESDNGRFFSLLGAMVWAEARMADLSSAEATLRRLIAIDGVSRRWVGVPPASRASWNAEIERSRAVIAEARGEFGRAEAGYRAAIAGLSGNERLARSYSMDLAHARLGRVLAHQGRFLEAERETRTALVGGLRRSGRYSFQTVTLLNYLSGVLLAQGRYREVEMLARAGLEIHAKLGTRPDAIHLAFVGALLASALIGQERFADALVEWDAMRLALAGQPDVFEKHFATGVGPGVVYLYLGRPDDAIPVLTRVLERTTMLRGGTHLSTGIARGALALAYQMKGDRERALQEYRAAVPVLLTQREDGTGDGELSRTPGWVQRRILIHYATLLAQISGTPLERTVGVDAAAESFRIADIARGQAVQDALNAAAVRASIHDPELADLVRREQDARKQITALQGVLATLASQPTDRQDTQATVGIAREVDALRGARQALAAQIRRDHPGYAELVNPPPATVDRVRDVLRPGEALVSTLVGIDDTVVWVVPREGRVRLVVVPIGERALRTAVAKLRGALDPRARTLGEIPEFDVGTAYVLYRDFLEPLSAGWRDADSLLVVADGPLAKVPFALLPTALPSLVGESGTLFSRYRGVSWLIRRHAVISLPSVSSLVTLRRLPARDTLRRPFAGFGDPYFSVAQAEAAARGAVQSVMVEGTDLAARAIERRNIFVTPGTDVTSARLATLPRLPDTAAEITAIGTMLGADPIADIFLGVRANEDNVRKAGLERYRVIAFATHGLVPGDLDGLTQPALALTAPEVAHVDGDGLLTMEKILALRLNADWVVLSACNTASGDGAGSEAISGLGRAFFYAGTRALLVSNRPVETTSARALTTDLFRRQAADPRLSRAKALQQTLNAMIDSGAYADARTDTIVFSYAHPIFWAPFTLVGDGGGVRE